MACSLPGRLGPCRKVGRQALLRTLPARPLHYLYPLKHLLIAGEGPECEELTGFDEGPMPEDWRGELERRGIRVTSGVLRSDALAVFAEYGRSGAIVYNARGTGSRLRG